MQPHFPHLVNLGLALLLPSPGNPWRCHILFLLAPLHLPGGDPQLEGAVGEVALLHDRELPLDGAACLRFAARA